MTLGMGPRLDCRNFVESQYQEHVLQQRREKGAAVSSVLFCAVPASEASGAGTAPFLACASIRGHVALHRHDNEVFGQECTAWGLIIALEAWFLVSAPAIV